MISAHAPGDFLVFQIESCFVLIRLLAIDDTADGKVWHVSAYGEFFIDTETAEAAAADPSRLSVSSPHIALTNRAFETTQAAKLFHSPLTNNEMAALDEWRKDPEGKVFDRTIRLILGLR